MSRKIKLFLKGIQKSSLNCLLFNGHKVTLSNCHKIFQMLTLNLGTLHTADRSQTAGQRQHEERGSQRHQTLKMPSASVPGMDE